MDFLRSLFPTCCWILLGVAAVCLGSNGDDIDGTGCPKVFRGRCHCGKVRYKYWRSDTEVKMVNCTNTNFNDTSMLTSIPSDTEVLIFNGNNVPNLDWNLFGIWDEHTSLRVVDLTNNRIRTISGKTFHKVGFVRRLLLDHNDLIISGPNLHPRLFSNFYNLEALHLTNAFTEAVDAKWYLSDLKQVFLGSEMKNLKKLHLEQNEIWRIEDDDMFCVLPSLTDLHLGDNQLKTVNFSLDCMKQLGYLDLQYNKIQRLDDKTIAKIEDVFAKNTNRTLNLKGNPFNCDCYLKNVYDWLANTKTSFYHKEELRCFNGYPVTNAGKRILNLRRLDCPPKAPRAPDDHSHHSGGGSVTNGLLATLCVLVALVAVILVLYHRQRISDSIKPLVIGFQKSMQYRTIDREDRQGVVASSSSAGVSSSPVGGGIPQEEHV